VQQINLGISHNASIDTGAGSNQEEMLRLRDQDEMSSAEMRELHQQGMVSDGEFSRFCSERLRLEEIDNQQTHRERDEERKAKEEAIT